MLSNEIKAKINSIYWGQKVASCKYNGTRLDEVGAHNIHNLDYLLLRSVKQLTDEEYIRLSHIFDRYSGSEDDFVITRKKAYIELNCTLQGIDLCIWDTGEISYKVEESPCDNGLLYHYAYDYLRSIAIALPITLLVDGAVRTIGVEEMVDNGVIKLKED